jgi:hypothetical protein
MAFDPSLEKVYLKFLEDFKNDIELAAFKMAQNAARSIISSLGNVIQSKEFRDIVKRASGSQAKAAAAEFLKEFKKQVAQTASSMKTLSNTIADIEKRTGRLAARMTKGFSDSTKIALQMHKVIKDIDGQLQKNAALSKKLIREMHASMAKNNLAPGQQGPTLPGTGNPTALREQLDAIKQMNKDLRFNKQAAQVLPDAMHQLNIKEKMADIVGKYLGPIDKFFSGIRVFAGVVKLLFSSPFGVLLGAFIVLFEVVSALFGQIQESLRVFRAQGFTGSQSMFLMGSANIAQGQALKRGVVASLEEASQYTAAMAQELGTLHVPQKFLADAIVFGKTFRISDKEMATLTALQYRLGGRNVVQTSQALMDVANVALRSGMSMQQVSNIITDNAEEFAKSSVVSMKAFAQAAVDSKKLGVNIGSVSHLADSLVSDFEGALRSQATLQTFFPQANMTPLMFASQFGSHRPNYERIKGINKGIRNGFWKYAT